MTGSYVNKRTRRVADEATFCHNRVSKYVNSEDLVVIRDELRSAPSTECEIHNIKDVILRAGTEKRRDNTNLLNEKYILRWSMSEKDDIELIKECTNGSKVKSMREKITSETALRIIDRSTKWLCASISPLIRELGVKMTTERLRPESVMSFERESFTVENRLHITADSGIVMCDYDGSVGIDDAVRGEPVDTSVCLLQVNYERIIPEHISSLIGIKAN